MELNNKINKFLTNLIINHFDSDVSGFSTWIADTFNDAQIGTGTDLLGQVQDDIDAHEQGYNTVSNLSDLQLSAKVLKHHPNMWFIYSSADSLIKPLSLKNLTTIKNTAKNNNALPVDLLPNEQDAKNQLKALV